MCRKPDLTVIGRFRRVMFAGAASLVTLMSNAQAQSGPVIFIGDSLGQGVQSADAAYQTQALGYVSWLAFQMGQGVTLPLIATDFLGIVGDTEGRARLEPNEIATNVAVSGATVASLLRERAAAASVAEISTETELVMFPRQQSQIEYVESAEPYMVVCWVGNNDALSAATSFSALNASQLTPLADFERDFVELADRLQVLISTHGTKVVFANIPNVTDIGFLVDRAAVEQVLRMPADLPDGHYTSVVGLILMAFLGDAGLLADPNFVLDSDEVAIVQARIAEFNAIIEREAGRLGMPVVDMNTVFQETLSNPPTFFGIPVERDLQRGLFSGDGVHPSNIGNALVANEFIATMNEAFSMGIPEISDEVLAVVFLTDPNIDKDFDGRSTGRLGVGLVETLFWLLGLSGDSDDLTPDA